MDMVTLRIIFTVVCLCSFLGIVGWAYARRNKSEFEEAGRLPLAED